MEQPTIMLVNAETGQPWHQWLGVVWKKGTSMPMAPGISWDDQKSRYLLQGSCTKTKQRLRYAFPTSVHIPGFTGLEARLLTFQQALARQFALVGAGKAPPKDQQRHECRGVYQSQSRHVHGYKSWTYQCVDGLGKRRNGKYYMSEAEAAAACRKVKVCLDSHIPTVAPQKSHLTVDADCGAWASSDTLCGFTGSGQGRLGVSAQILRHAEHVKLDGVWLEVCDLYLWCLRDGIRMEVVHNGLGQVQAASVRAFFEVALPGLHGVHSNLVDNRDLPCWKFVLTKAAGHANWESTASPSECNHWCPAWSLADMASPDLVAAAADLHFAKTISGLRTVLSMGRLDAAVEATVRWDIEEVETTRAGFAVFQRRFLETNMALRLEVADAWIAVAGDPQWQQAFLQFGMQQECEDAEGLEVRVATGADMRARPRQL
eukprot:s2078_g5.t1